MRDVTIKQAEAEIEVLDKVSSGLQDAIRKSYEYIQANNPAINKTGDDIELLARLHNNRLGLSEALEEVARRGYGRVVVVREVNDKGGLGRALIYRVSQANAGLPEASIVGRNSALGSQIASCRVGEELEIRLPTGERYFAVTDLIDLEGGIQLLRVRPDIKLARFYVTDDPDVDVIRNVRDFLERTKAQTEARATPAAADIKEAEEGLKTPEGFDRFWPANWSSVIFADEPEAALGAHFFTRTTRQQEDAIRAVRGVTVVHGIAGTGKTSVALGRLKFFANFRSGENLNDYGLNPNDWVDFDSSDMIGFVLSPSLVQYLKQTAEDLEMHIKIMDFEEFRNQERQVRRLFSRPFKRSAGDNSQLQRTVRWLRALADAAAFHVAAAIELTQQEPFAKPDTPDGIRVSDARWQELERHFWKSGPLKARIVGLTRRLSRKDDVSSASIRLQGLANSLDRDIRLSDVETASLSAVERRAVREAVLNIALRYFRLLNPSDLYVAAHKSEFLAKELEVQFEAQSGAAIDAAKSTALRLDERLITDDDIVTSLCLNALECDGFERDIRDIPYVRTFSDRVGVFIDEYQDFSEQQVFLMGFRAKRKYRQITVAGDSSQRLHIGGLANIANAFPYVTEPIRQILLDTNFRQSKWLAQLSNRFRAFTDGRERAVGEVCGAPIYIYQDRREFAEFIASKISALPDQASVVIISASVNTVRSWFDVMAPSLESAFRSPIISDRARLTERLKTHFTTPMQAKGLEFDVAIIPDISEFNDADPIALNSLYVAVSRPRHALLLGCEQSRIKHMAVSRLAEGGDLIPTEFEGAFVP